MTLTIQRAVSDAPLELTHYTDLNGLCGIVGTGQLWASSVSFLNDRQELLYGLDSALEVAERIAKKETYAHWRTALRKAVEALKGGALPSTYALCLCTEDDVLSQWRGYGGQVQGVALTFDQLALTDLLENVKARLIKVVYDHAKMSTIVTNEIRAKLDELDLFDDLLGRVSEAEKLNRATEMISSLLPQFKHRGFADEREHRYVIQHDTVREAVCFRVVRNVIAPYLKLPAVGQKLPVKRVTVGPGHDQALTRQSLQIYLARHGYSEVEVTLSQVPFRT